MLANLCALEIIGPFYSARFYIYFYFIYNNQSLKITPQNLLNNKSYKVILSEIKYITLYALLINVHNHFIFHLIKAVSACVFL